MKLKNDFVAITEYSKRPTKNELGGDGCPTLGLWLMALNCMFKMVMILNFMVYIYLQ